jgi:hypothetical protein
MTDAASVPPEVPPPPPTVPETVAAAAPAVTGGGSSPVGKVRSPAAVVIFMIITFGIYGAVWTYMVFKELKDRTGEGLGGIVALVILLLLAPVIWFVLPSEIGTMYETAGREKPVRGVTGFWNLIPLVGFIIWVVKVQGALNRAWQGAV